ncbi:glutamate receptor 2.7 [Triticum aestivum]|uniref:glutamate receptor 2.7 n=2 Tax=Triticum TaxID=4564 RepID=UPI001D03037C|nr:glutamate receptor 2.7-like [Triticum aestivum]
MHMASPVVLRANVACQLLGVLFLFLLDGAATAASVPPPPSLVTANVGVILDLATELGKKSLLSMEMALHDFYATHPSYTTRVKLHVRDSHQDVVTAASAAIDLIDNKKVGVVIGPQNTLQAEFLTYLANKTKVPFITSSATGDTITQCHAPYFLHACVKGSSQAASIAAFIKAYGWKNVVLVHEDNNHGLSILPSITSALESIDVHVINHSAIPTTSPDYRIDVELYKLKTMQTRVFIVHMLPADASRLFARASTIGMMTEGYVWIVTDDIGNALDVLPQHTIETMQGVVGFRPYVAKTTRINGFMARFVTQYRSTYHKDPDVRVAKPTIFQYWSYDLLWAIASATEKAKRFRSLQLRSKLGNMDKLVDDLQASPAEPELLTYIMDGEYEGLAGRFMFVDRHLPVPTYEIVNVIEEEIRRIGFWNLGNGLSAFLNSSTRPGQAKHTTRADQVTRTVIWPGNSITVPRGWGFPENGTTLQIGVPVRRDSEVFVHVETNPSSSIPIVKGYSIDVFEAAVKKLPYGLRYRYIPYDCSDSYDTLVSQVYFKKFDAVVGDVTIIANRTRYVDFTVPYTDSGVSMLVLASKDEDEPAMWVFLEPLTKDLWIAIILFMFFTGLIVWMIEKPINDELRGSKWKQFNAAFYFAFFTGTSMHDQKFKSLQSKVIVVSWCFVMVIIVQSYTASLSSILTAKKLPPLITDPRQLLQNDDNVGYQSGSFVHSMLRRLQFEEPRIKAFSTHEEYAKALRSGSKNEGVSAIFDETPYINSFLLEYGKEFRKVFPKGSPLVDDLSKAVLNLIEGSEGSSIEKKWFKDSILSPDYGSLEAGSPRLSSRSFAGLFIINGCVLGLMVVINLLRRAYAKYIAKGSSPCASDGGAQRPLDGEACSSCSDESQNSPISLIVELADAVAKASSM